MNLSGSAALDVLLGLFFLYFLLSIVCSAINESIASALNMRAKYLERGIRTLLGRETHVRSFYGQWRAARADEAARQDLQGPAQARRTSRRGRSR